MYGVNVLFSISSLSKEYVSLLECMGIELCIYLKRRSILVHLCHNLCLFNFENVQLHEPRVRRLDAASLD